jgi:hypothetical protein
VFQIQKKLDEEEAAQITTEPTDSGCETMSEEEDSADLWVEKYKPKSYLELLSDEVNGYNCSDLSRCVSVQDVCHLGDNYVCKFIKQKQCQLGNEPGDVI